MSKVLYTKYNSTRLPKFQTSTMICEQDEQKYVLKKPLQKSAEEHIDQILKSSQLIQNLYKNIHIINAKRVEDGICFPYLDGHGLLKDIDFSNDKIEDIVDHLKQVISKINNYNEEHVIPFEMTDEFECFFKGARPVNEPAVKIANIDGIFANFIEKSNGELWCIDYEWVLEFPVPIRYIIYRSLLYLYVENGNYLSDRVSLKEFLYCFDFTDVDIALFDNMEEAFQQYVHGENRAYIYTNNYRKESKDLRTIVNLAEGYAMKENELELANNHAKNLQNVIDKLNYVIENRAGNTTDLEAKADELNETIHQSNVHINNQQLIIQEQQMYISKMKRAIKNPFYAGYLGLKKIKNKYFAGRVAKIQQKENAKILEYREKYKSLMNLDENNYEEWITKLESEETYDEKFEYNPKISVIVPVYNVLDKHLVPCIESVLNQVYTNWELCLADDNSTWENVKATLEKYEKNEKIKVVYRKENGHISKCTNSALEVATGEFVAFMDCDDLLRSNALYEVVKKLNENPDLDFIYSDEDKVDDDGNNRHMPHFKPDWSPDTLMSIMYTCHLGVYRRSIVDEIGGLRTGVEGSQDYDFTLRFTEKTDKVAHIDKILYHWRERLESTASHPGAKPYILEAAKKTKQEALERRGLKGEVELVENIYQYRVNYISQTNPLITIIIPSKDNYAILERCIKSLVSITEYKNYEIILVDNGSNTENHANYAELSKEYNINYIYAKMDFNFSRMCNIGAQAAKGEYLLFLNDDIEIISGEWLSRMIGHAELEHIGAVGAKLLYPDSDKIQHVGVLGLECGPSHAFTGYSDANSYYFCRNKLEYNWLAVTAACLLVSKEKFNQVNGFDEDLAVAYNDMDLNFKLVEAGYYNVVRTDAVLYHHESISRGYDAVDEAKMQRLMRELKKLYAKHPCFEKKDPFYSSKLVQNNVDFDCNYTLLKQDLNVPVKYEGKISESVDLCCSVDILNNMDIVYIEGWAFIDGREDNNDAKVQVFLNGEESSYIIDTEKVYRPDVAKVFESQKYIEFVGYKCRFEKEVLQAENYEIGIVINSTLKFTGRNLSVE